MKIRDSFLYFKIKFKRGKFRDTIKFDEFSNQNHNENLIKKFLTKLACNPKNKRKTRKPAKFGIIRF